MTTATDLAELDFGFDGEPFYPLASGAAPTDFTAYGFDGEQMTIYAASADATLALTGVAATPAVDTLAPAHTVKTDGGVHATCSVGTITVPMTQALTGNAATVAASKPSTVHTLALSGNDAVGNVGVVAPVLTAPITGAESVGAAGDVAVLSAGTIVPITGNMTTGDVGFVVYVPPAILAEQTPTLIITDANTVDVSTRFNNVETSVSL